MYSVLLTAVVGFALSFLLTPLVRDLFLRWGIVDEPDGVRKLHSTPVPRVGGIPIAIAYSAAYAVLIISPLRGGAWLERELPLIWTLMPAAGVVFGIGLIDDFRGVRPTFKITAQLVAAVLAYLSGVEIANIAGFEIPSWSSLPLTVIWLVGCTNAFNLIDGVDGLATGVGILATLTIFGAALLQQNTPLTLATVPLAACLLGFLRFNFNPASIFLGDSGSLLVGFLLGCYGVIWSQKSATILGMTAPLMALAVPLMDTALAIVRRFLRGKPIFAADRGHMHHRLLDLGLAPRRVALLLYGVCGLAATLSLLSSAVHPKYAALVVVVFLATAWIGVRQLGYDEFAAVRRIISGGEIQSRVNAQLSLRNLERALCCANDFPSCWRTLHQGCRELGFSHAVLRLNGISFPDDRKQEVSRPAWYLHVPLSGADFVLLGRDSDTPVNPAVVEPLADLIRTSLRNRLAELTLRQIDSEMAANTESILKLADAIQHHQHQRPTPVPPTTPAAA